MTAMPSVTGGDDADGQNAVSQPSGRQIPHGSQQSGIEEVQAASIFVEFLQKHKTNAEALLAVDI